MNVVVIDGQSGRMGQLFVERAVAAGLPCRITAVGTNAIATSAMLKAGAEAGATGENAVLVACRGADVIAGPIGILAVLGQCVLPFLPMDLVKLVLALLIGKRLARPLGYAWN